MKKVDVLNFTQFLTNLKLNKFDKEIRAAIISNSLLANKIFKEFEENVQDAKKRYFEDLDDQVALLINYREKYKVANEEDRIKINDECVSVCADALNAEKEFNVFINNLVQEDVNLNFIKINRDVFVEQCANADIDITVATLELLKGLFN